MADRVGTSTSRLNAFGINGQPIYLCTDGHPNGAYGGADKGDSDMTDIDYPYHFSGQGRTATTAYETHIRDLIEQVIFTSPGERVNRPTFGSGLLQLVFAPNSEELAGTTQFLVQSSLQEWLGDLILVDSVEVESIEERLNVTVSYLIRRTQQQRIDQFSR